MKENVSGCFFSEHSVFQRPTTQVVERWNSLDQEIVDACI